jgi:hypothetical protein
MKGFFFFVAAFGLCCFEFLDMNERCRHAGIDETERGKAG